jgi:hypothetical protein
MRQSGCCEKGGIGKNRDWTVLDPRGPLVCLTVYKRGAVEVIRGVGGARRNVIGSREGSAAADGG